jgi:hypothetical protein
VIPAVPTNHKNIETTLRESMLYEAGVLAGEARARKEAAEQISLLAGEVQQKDTKPLADSLTNIAALLNEVLADLKRKSRLRGRVNSAAVGLPLSAAALAALVAGVVDHLTKTAGALSLGAAKGQEEFARQLAAIGELIPPAEPQARRPRSRLARVLIGIAELRESTRVDSAK